MPCAYDCVHPFWGGGGVCVEETYCECSAGFVDHDALGNPGCVPRDVLLAGYILITVVGTTCSLFLIRHALRYRHLPLSVRASHRALLRQRLTVSAGWYTVGCYATRHKKYSETKRLYERLGLCSMAATSAAGILSWYRPTEAMIVADVVSSFGEAVVGVRIVNVARQTSAAIDRRSAHNSPQTPSAFYSRAKQAIVGQVRTLLSAALIYVVATYMLHFTDFGKHTAILFVVIKFSDGMLWLCVVVHFARPLATARLALRGSLIPGMVSYLAHYGGTGLSRAELMHGYNAWKSATFRRFTSSSKAHVARRQEKLCELFAPNSRPAHRKVSRVAPPPRGRPKAAAPTVNHRDKQNKAREKRRAEREKEQAAANKKAQAAAKQKSPAWREAAEKRREQSAARRASADRKKARDATAARLRAVAKGRNDARLARREAAEKRREQSPARRASADRKKARDATAARLRAVAKGRNDARLALREAAEKRREQSAARRASEERRKKASEERRRKLKGKGKATPSQHGTSPTADQRKAVNDLRKRFCKDSFRSPTVQSLSHISRKAVQLRGKLQPKTFKPCPPAYNALRAYRLSPPADGTCMWMSIAAGLLGSPGQWKLVKRGGESLCDRLMTWFQQYQSEGRRHGFDFGFIKWIFLKYLREMPLRGEKKHLLDVYNTQDEGGDGTEKVDVDDRERWPTEEEAYDEITDLYAAEVMGFTYWGGPVEVRLLSKAFYPLVDFGVFILPNKHEIKGRHKHLDPKSGKWGLIDGPKLTEPRMQFSVRSRPKPASVLLLLNDNRSSHYELLSLYRRRKDFLVLEEDIPEYMFLPYER